MNTRRQFTLAILFGVLLSHANANPAWWPALTPNSANDFGVANIGQLKNMAKHARDHLDDGTPGWGGFRGGAGTEIDELFNNAAGLGWDDPPVARAENASVLLVGQLKHVASLFYDRLIGEGYAKRYPWTLHTGDDGDYSPANIGQLKNMFSFDVTADADADGLPDLWEVTQFGATDRVSGAEDGDGDGLTTSEEFTAGLDPRDSDSDTDGFPDNFSYGLSGHYRFDEASGAVAADSSRAGNHGDVLVGIPPQDPTPDGYLNWTGGGVDGGAIEFGSDDVAPDFPRVSLPHTVLDGAGDVSLSFWVKFDASDPANPATDQAMVAAATGGNDNELLLMWDCSPSGTYAHLRFFTGEGPGSNVAWLIDNNPADGWRLFDDRWHHLSVLRDQTGGTVSLYIDGELEGAPATTPLSDLAVAAGGLILGQEQDVVGGVFNVNQRFRGSMDDLRFYRRVLTEDEISQLVDTDSDGLPDWWERKFFGSLALGADDDPDGDTLINIVEFAGSGVLGTPEEHGGDPRWPGISGTHVEDGHPIITELMASNKDAHATADDPTDFPDWFELFNPGGASIDLGDYTIGLLGDADHELPGGTLEPGQRLIVYAWGDNHPSGTGVEGHYVGFKLSQDTGGALVLKDTVSGAGTLQTLAFPGGADAIPTDESFGLSRLWNEIGYLEFPTPGLPNSDLVQNSDSPAPELSAPGGFYSGSVEISVVVDLPPDSDVDPSTVDGVDVFITTDGSEPGPGSPTAFVYEGPFEVGTGVAQNIVRAATYRRGFRPSATVTESYLIPDLVVTSDGASKQERPAEYPTDSGFPGLPLNYGIEVVDGTEAGAVRNGLVQKATGALPSVPTLSIVTDRAALFGETGIYSNPFLSGDEGTRQVSLEWFEPPTNPTDPDDHGSRLFKVGCGLKIHGGSSRRPDVTVKHSFRLKFDVDYAFADEYGAGEDLVADVFGGGVSTFDELLLRTPTHDSFAVGRFGGQDWSAGREQATYVRDTFAAELQRELGHLTPRRRWVHVYLNGMYWGIYEAMERPNKDFLTSHQGGGSGDILTINGGEVVDDGAFIDQDDPDPAPPATPDGRDDKWVGLMETAVDLARNSDPPFSSAQDRHDAYTDMVEDEINIDSLIDHIIINAFIENRDWPDRNYWAFKNDAAPDPAYQRFSFSVWDAEWSMRGEWDGNQMVPTWATLGGLSRINRTGNLFSARTQSNIDRDYTAAPGILYFWLKQYSAVIPNPDYPDPDEPEFLYPEDFNDRFRIRLEEIFTLPNLSQSKVRQIYQDQADNVARIMHAEAARWGHVYQIADQPTGMRDAKFSDWKDNSDWIHDHWLGSKSPDNTDYPNPDGSGTGAGFWRGDYLEYEFAAPGEGDLEETENGIPPIPDSPVSIQAHLMPEQDPAEPPIPRPAAGDAPYVAGFWANSDSDDPASFDPDGDDDETEAGDDDLMKLVLHADIALHPVQGISGQLSLFVPEGIRVFTDNAPGTEAFEGFDGEMGPKLIVLNDGQNPAAHFFQPLVEDVNHTQTIYIEGGIDGFGTGYASGVITLVYAPADVATELDNGGSGADELYLVPTEKDPCQVHFSGSLNEITGPKHRKISLDGFPMGESKPQGEGETDQEPEETYIDALTLRLNHETTDVFVPLVAGELSLSVRRNATTDIVGDHQELPTDLYGERAFGLGWRSALSPSIRIAEYVPKAGEANPSCPADAAPPDYAYVTDENGSVHRFIRIKRLDESGDEEVAFVPIPSNRTEQETWLMSLTYDETEDEYTFVRKFGTTLVYDGSTTAAISETIPANPGGESHTHQSYARLVSAVDRVGNRLLYDYPDGDSLIPSWIYAVTDQGLSSQTVLSEKVLSGRGFRALKIGAPGNVVETVTDPRGNVYRFSYIDASIPVGPSGFGLGGLKLLTKVTRPDGTFVSYGYETFREFDDTPKDPESTDINFFYHFNLNSIADANGNTTTLYYQRDTSRLDFNKWTPPPGFFAPPGQPRVVSRVDRPLGGADFGYEPYNPVRIVYGDDHIPQLESELSPSPRRVTYVRDATKHLRSYTFEDPDVIDASEFETVFAAGGSTRRADLLVRWNKMTLTHPVASPIPGQEGEPATEVFEFDPGAGMAVKQVTDFSGNVTTYAYDDQWSITQVVPWLDDFDGKTINDLGAHALFYSRYSDPTGEIVDPGGLALSKTFEYQSSIPGTFSRVMGSITDPRGNETTYAIDPNTGLRKTEEFYEADPDGGAATKLLETSFEYASGRFPGFITKKSVLGANPAADIVTTYEPDDFGNVAEEIVGGADARLTTQHKYDPNGNKIETIDPNGNLTEFKYDKRNRLVKVIHPATEADNGAEVSTTLVYDARGNKVREIDPNQISTFYAYDALNRVVRVTRDMGTHDSATGAETAAPDGEPGTRSDPLNTDLITSFTYNLAGAKLEAQDPNGNRATTLYDAMQRPVSSTDAGGNTTSFSYGPNCGSTIFNVSGFQPTGITGPRGFQTLCTYDNAYRKTEEARQWESTSQALGDYASTRTVYDNSGNPILVTDPGGIQTVTRFDGMDRATHLATGVTGIDPATFTGATDAQFDNHPWTVEKEFTATGLVSKVTDEMDRVTETVYDSAGRPVDVFAPETWYIDAAGNAVRGRPMTRTVYDDNSNVIQTISPRLLATSYVFDERNRQIEVEGEQVWNPDKAGGAGDEAPRTVTRYDLAGNVTSVTDALQNETLTYYDHAYRAILVKTPSVTVVTDAGNPEAPLTAQQPLTTRTSYDPNGNVLTLTDPAGNITTNTYDAINRLITTSIDPDTSVGGDEIVVKNLYDRASNLVQVEDGKGQFTRFAYDGLNRQTQQIFDPQKIHKVDHPGYDPEDENTFADSPFGVANTENQITVHTYDETSKIATTDPTDRTTWFYYNERYWLTELRYKPDSTATRPANAPAASDANDRAFTHDAVGNLLTAIYPHAGADPAADATYVYDEHNRLVAEKSAGKTHGHAYDADGNRAFTAYEHGFDYANWDPSQGPPISATWGRLLLSSYDELNRLVSITENDGTATRTTSYTYDLNGNRRMLQLPNGVVQTCTYDAINRRLTSTTGSVLTCTYGYDANSDVAHIAEDFTGVLGTDRKIGNRYDGARRLVEEVEKPANSAAVTTTYEYDKANNRTKKTSAGVITDYVFNNRLNQLDSYTDGTTTTGFEYDPAGNRTERKVDGVLDTTYSYDHDNRLVTLDDTTNSKTYSYAYDHRTRRVVRDESAAGGDEIKLSFIGGTSAMEMDGAATAATFIRGSDYGGGVGGMLYSVRGGTPSYAHSNHRGDIVAKTDTNGDITWQAAYEAYGTRPQDSAPGFGTNQDRQRGNTKDEDPTGLLNEGFRYRDLEAGVFLTQDPAGFVDGPNLYTYARQNPWTGFDPLGLEARKVGKYTIKGKGHHPVTVESMQRHDMHPTLAEELDKQSIKTNHSHGGAGHKHYNKLEGEIVDKKVAALKKKGVKVDKSAKMTQAQAKKIADQLVGAVKNTDDKYVKWFLGAVETKDSAYIAKHGTILRVKMHAAAGTKASASLLARAGKYMPKNSALLKAAKTGGKALGPALLVAEGFSRKANASLNYPSDEALYGKKAANRMYRERLGSLSGRTTEETRAKNKERSDAFFDWLTR